MSVYRRATTVDVPLSAVWAFHVRIDGLTAVTPDWLDLRVESIERPPGHADDRLVAGTRVRLSVRPFGVGPRQSWTSVIRESEERGDEAVLRDEMVEGPFPQWIHTHRFTAIPRADQAAEERSGSDDGRTETRPPDDAGMAPGGATRVSDVVEYRLPGGPVGRTLSPLAIVGLEPMFRYRHRRTRALLEGDTTGWRGETGMGGDP